jgi:WD40 repeat protein
VFGTFGSSYAKYSLPNRTWNVARIDDTPGINAGCVCMGAIYSVGDAGIVCRDGRVVARLGSLCNFIMPWGRRLVTGGQLGVLFDALTGEVLYRHRSPLNCGASWAAKERQVLVVGSYTGEGLVFDQTESGEVRFLRMVALHDNALKGLACNGTQLFSVCATTAAAFHDAETFEPVKVIPHAHDKIANGAACLPDGRFVSVSRDRKLRFLTPTSCRAVSTPHDHSIKCVAVLGPAHWIATGSYDGKVAIYDWVRDEWPVVQQVSRFGISSLAADEAAGKFLATSYDGNLYRLPVAV